MRSQVIVKWADQAVYQLDQGDGSPLSNEQARAWLDEQFTVLECEPIRLTGKVLTADKLLCVALAAGEERFRDPAHQDWAVAYARAAGAALGKPVITVDLQAQTVGY